MQILDKNTNELIVELKAVESYQFSLGGQVRTNPIERGYQIADHMLNNPPKLSLLVKVDRQDQDTILALQTMHKKRTVVCVQEPEPYLQEAVLENLDANYEAGNGFIEYTLDFAELSISSLRTEEVDQDLLPKQVNAVAEQEDKTKADPTPTSHYYKQDNPHEYPDYPRTRVQLSRVQESLAGEPLINAEELSNIWTIDLKLEKRFQELSFKIKGDSWKLELDRAPDSYLVNIYYNQALISTGRTLTPTPFKYLGKSSWTVNLLYGCQQETPFYALVCLNLNNSLENLDVYSTAPLQLAFFTEQQYAWYRADHRAWEDFHG